MVIALSWPGRGVQIWPRAEAVGAVSTRTHVRITVVDVGGRVSEAGSIIRYGGGVGFQVLLLIETRVQT
jgi:hypothetical protein